MRRDELHYDLPPERIAQRPATPRDAARLLVLDRASGVIAHRVFRDIGEYLAPGDCLVLNDTRVIPARFSCRRSTGGRVGALFLREHEGLWRALLKPSARLSIGERLLAEGAETAFVLCERHERGEWSLRPDPPTPADKLLGRIGTTPLPPYIRRDPSPDALDAQRYQTVYAKQAGAVAAPTAGMHFTPELLERLREAGVGRADVTLHVSSGTFAPLEVDDLAQHRMHAERFEAGGAALATIGAARRAGGRIVAVGTTSARVLESVTIDEEVASVRGETDLFIYPPHRWRNVDVLLTNFHLPRSTLLALVMAFAGIEPVRAAYREAVVHEYRFYSYGDAMLIL